MTGFSNGGAASVALTRDHPEYFAAISAMGWIVDLDNKDHVFGSYDMPFQVVQGSGDLMIIIKKVILHIISPGNVPIMMISSFYRT